MEEQKEKIKELKKEIEREVMEMKQGEERTIKGIKIKIGEIRPEEICWHLL